MTDEQAKALGERALALAGQPPRGVLWRITHTEAGPQSWPDLRDEITEAWLVAWVQLDILQGGHIFQEDPGTAGDTWQIEVHEFDDGGWVPDTIVVQGKTRAEAWIMALEKLKGD